MPFINLKVAGPLTVEQRKEIARRFSQTLLDVAGKKPETTYIVFEEISRDRWAVGETLLSE